MRALLAARAANGIPRRAGAQPTNVIRLRVMNDRSSTCCDHRSTRTVACVRQAVAEFATAHGLNVQVLTGDDQSKADIAVNIAW